MNRLKADFDSPRSASGPRVLHFTTWDEACGIAGYARDLIGALDARGVVNGIYPVNRAVLRGMTFETTRNWLNVLAEQARGYDVLHIQHEFSFFGPLERMPEPNELFFGLLDRLQKDGTPTVVTFHTEPYFIPHRPTPMQRARRFVHGGFHRWKSKRYLGSKTRNLRALVHAEKTRGSLINSGVHADLVSVIPMGIKPRAEAVNKLSKAEAKARLGLSPDCVLLTLFGFVSEYKGHLTALEAMVNLPEKFALAIVGGPHPEGNDGTFDKVLRARRELGRSRLLVTGFVEFDELDLYHAATDICLAPYQDPTQSGSAGITWAIGSGRPIVASDIPCFRELNSRREIMQLTSAARPGELAWHVERLAADPARQADLVANAAQFVRESSWDTVAALCEKAYGEVTGRPMQTAKPQVFEARIAAAA